MISVERRAELVRHLGEELRLVPAGDFELPVLLVELADELDWTIAIAPWAANVSTSSISGR